MTASPKFTRVFGLERAHRRAVDQVDLADSVP
jgi:hypothetical protein